MEKSWGGDFVTAVGDKVPDLALLACIFPAQQFHPVIDGAREAGNVMAKVQLRQLGHLQGKALSIFTARSVMILLRYF